MTTMTYADALDQFVSSDFNEIKALTTNVFIFLNGNKTSTVKSLLAMNSGQFDGFYSDIKSVAFSTENRELISKLATKQCEYMDIDDCIFSLMASFSQFNELGMTIEEIVALFISPENSSQENYDFFWSTLTEYASKAIATWFNDFIKDENIELVESITIGALKTKAMNLLSLN